MKTLTTTLLISLALVGAGAQAAGVEQAKSSAQVATELQQAKISGQYTFGELDYPPALPQAASLSAQEVQAQLQQAKTSGEYTFGELQYPPVKAAASVKTRADFQQELAQAKASGQYTFGELEYPPITR